MNTPFEVRQRLRFGHCDPAGIAYYPRYFELCDGVIEDWTEQVVGVSRRKMHLELGWALPTVDLNAQFVAVSVLGDWLDFSLTVTAVGRSSVALALSASCGGEARFDVQYKQVLIDSRTTKSIAWPDEWRARILESVN
ncbi:MAG: acyl-CoA thioesterase [Sphingomonadaceae bacterium]|nr:acyl-CoA thioesterase [Sphingomonadaceae bacterium]